MRTISIILAGIAGVGLMLAPVGAQIFRPGGTAPSATGYLPNKALRTDGAGRLATVSGSDTDCVRVNGTASACGSGGPGGGGTWGSITGTLSAQTDLNAALAAKAPLASPALTGAPTAPTPSTGDASMRLATTLFVDQSTASVVGGQNVTVSQTGSTITVAADGAGGAMVAAMGVQVATTTSQPACDSGRRGTFWVVQGGVGSKDAVSVCAKDAANTYAWRVLY
jgi:hypothetical protein